MYEYVRYRRVKWKIVSFVVFLVDTLNTHSEPMASQKVFAACNRPFMVNRIHRCAWMATVVIIRIRFRGVCIIDCIYIHLYS